MEHTTKYPRSFLSKASAEARLLLEAITSDGEADWSTLEKSWFSTGRTSTELVANGLAHGFAILRNPLRLRPARNSPWLAELQSGA